MLRTFRLGDARPEGEGLRIGAVRYLPRGVRKEDYAVLDYFDVWLPVLAPSRELLRWAKARNLGDKEMREMFFSKYQRQMLGETDSRQALELLRRLARRTAISVGCYCEVESQCHRSVLRRLIEG